MAECSIIHLTNVFILSPLVLLPFVAGWQMALPLAFFQSVTGKRALDQSFKSIRAGKMMVATAIALVLVCCDPDCASSANCKEATPGIIPKSDARC